MHASVTQSLVAERDKAFRAQAFSLKQLNTRVVQLQHQQTEQASREAALLQELSLGSLEGQSSTAESLVAASEHGSMSTLKRGQSQLPPGMETMRRRLEPIMSSGELKPLHSVEMRFYCPQTFLYLDFQFGDDVSELK